MSETSRQWRLLGPERIELAWTPVPEPRGRELLVRVLAATTCGTDLKVFRRGGHPRMLQPPCPFGHELCGEIVAVGPDQDRLAIGERVVIANSAPCGSCRQCRRGRHNLCSELAYLNGAFADHLLVPARFAEVATHPVDARVASAEAALAEPLACALHCLELLEPTLDRWLGAGDVERPAVHALVLGAGPLGLLLAGLLARRGVAVTCADPYPARLEVARAFGATDVVVVRDRDAPLPEDARFDSAIDATGSPAGWQACLRHLDVGGVAVFFGGTASGVVLEVDAQALHYDELGLLGVYHHRPANVTRAVELITEGALPLHLLISAQLPLERLDDALERMSARTALKVALIP